MTKVVDMKRITTTEYPLVVIGEVAAGIRPSSDPEFKAASRMLLTKHLRASLVTQPVEAVAA